MIGVVVVVGLLLLFGFLVKVVLLVGMFFVYIGVVWMVVLGSSLMVIVGLICVGICLFWCVLVVEDGVLFVCKVFICIVEFIVVVLLLSYGIVMSLFVGLLM